MLVNLLYSFPRVHVYASFIIAIAIVREIQGQLIMEKGLATFTAEVASDGITGYWTKHGVVLQSSEKYQVL